jgi:copper chaperone CopZ
MKTKLIALLSIFLVCGISMDVAAQENKKKKNTEEVLFNVNMHCESCRKKIEKQISFEKGVSDLSVDLATNTVWIEYKSNKTSEDKLKATIEKMGYEVSVEQEEPSVETEVK